MEGLQWKAPNSPATRAPLVMPLETQFYIGFYNKSLFARAGITSVPTDWSQLFAACTKLKAKGVHPSSTATAARPSARSSTPGTT